MISDLRFMQDLRRVVILNWFQDLENQVLDSDCVTPVMNQVGMFFTELISFSSRYYTILASSGGLFGGKLSSSSRGVLSSLNREDGNRGRVSVALRSLLVIGNQ